MTTPETNRSLTWLLLLAGTGLVAVGLVGVAVHAILSALSDSPAPTDTPVAAAPAVPDAAPAAPAPVAPAAPTSSPLSWTSAAPPDEDVQRRQAARDRLKRLREEAQIAPAAERGKIEAEIQRLEEATATPR